MVSGHQRHMIAWGWFPGAAYTSSKRTLDQMTQDKYDNGDRAEARTGGVKYDNNIYRGKLYPYHDMTYMGDTLGGFGNMLNR